MQENMSMEIIETPRIEQSSVPLVFASGGVWKMGKEYFLERRNYNHYLLLYTISGEGCLFYEDKEYQLLPGMAFLIDCRQYQVYRTATDRWEFVFIHFDTDCLREYVDDLYRQSGVIFRVADGKLMESYMKAVIELYQGYHRAVAHRAFGLLAQLLGMLYASAEQADTDNSISEYTESVLRIIEAHYSEKLTLDSIAQEIGYSKYYLAHQFKADMGIAIYSYLTLLRISKGKLLLQNTNLSVAEISGQVGFAGTSNFIRTFFEYEGMTPHQYRKQWQ